MRISVENVEKIQVQIWMPKLHVSQLPAPNPFEDKQDAPILSHNKSQGKKQKTPQTIQKPNGITNQLIPPITNLQPFHRRLITIFAIVESILIIRATARFLLIILRRATGFRIGVTRRRRVAVIESSTCGTVTCRRWCMGRRCLC